MTKLFNGLIIMVALTATAYASDFGTYDIDPEVYMAESMDIVESSRDLRRELKNDRYIAGSSQDDEKWVKFYDNLMADNSSTDWLKKADEIE